MVAGKRPHLVLQSGVCPHFRVPTFGKTERADVIEAAAGL